MDELILDDKKYLSSKRAAQVTGYAKDYVGQLCREGRITARLVGRNWYVLEDSLLEHRFGAEEAEEKTQKPPEKKVQETWGAPRYTAEAPILVPEIPIKQVQEPVQDVAESSKVLVDMQSAWQEWFDQQGNEEKLLPDASPMLLEASEEPVSLPAPEAEEEVPVHIDRHREPLQTSETVVEQQRYIPATITKSYVQPKIRHTGDSYGRGGTMREKRGGVTPLIRVALLTISGLAVTITVIGSGLSDVYLRDIASLPITSFFAGVKDIEK